MENSVSSPQFFCEWKTALKNKAYFLPGGTVDETLPPNTGDTGSILVREDFTWLGVTNPVCYNY